MQEKVWLVHNNSHAARNYKHIIVFIYKTPGLNLILNNIIAKHKKIGWVITIQYVSRRGDEILRYTLLELSSSKIPYCQGLNDQVKLKKMLDLGQHNRYTVEFLVKIWHFINILSILIWIKLKKRTKPKRDSRPGLECESLAKTTILFFHLFMDTLLNFSSIIE